MGTDWVTFTAGDPQHIGQVQLPLGIIGSELGQRRPQDGGIEGEHTGVDLGDGALLSRGIFLFDDGDDFAILIADDTAITSGIIQVHGEHGDGGRCRGVGLQQCTEGVRGQQGDITIGDDDGALKSVQLFHGALHSVAGTILFLLQGNADLPIQCARNLLHSWADLITAVADDCDDVLGSQTRSGMETVRDEAAASDAVQCLLKI